MSDASGEGPKILGIDINRLTPQIFFMAALAAFMYWNNESGKEDRSMFREELKAIRSSQEERWIKTDKVHADQMSKMGLTIERSVAAMESAVNELKKSNERMRPSFPVGGGPGVP